MSSLSGISTGVNGVIDRVLDFFRPGRKKRQSLYRTGMGLMALPTTRRR